MDKDKYIAVDNTSGFGLIGKVIDQDEELTKIISRCQKKGITPIIYKKIDWEVREK